MPYTQHADHGSSRRHEPRLYNIVTVRFRTNFIKHDFDARTLQLRKGDEVLVETSRGPIIARVESQVQRRLLPYDHIPRIIRRATAEDLDLAVKNEEREESAYRFALERIRTRRLPMKLVRTQFVHDGSKIVFYFSADGRIDFRDLVKDLAHRFRTRIEMHQIGVRDGSRMIGGIGPCGRELCCSTFLENFAPVSIRMAKDQGLTLNPKKVSGMCGRLMCCLVYEQQVYKRMRRRLPRPGTHVFTEDGPGKIINVDIINERVTVEHEDTNRRVFAANEISLKEVVPLTVDADNAHEPDYLWEDLLAGLDDAESELSAALDDEIPDKPEPTKPSRSRRTRARRSASREPQSTEPDTSPEEHKSASSTEDDAQGARKSSRRRRGRSAKRREQASESVETTPSEKGEKTASSSRRGRRGRSRRGRGGSKPGNDSDAKNPKKE